MLYIMLGYDWEYVYLYVYVYVYEVHVSKYVLFVLYVCRCPLSCDHLWRIDQFQNEDVSFLLSTSGNISGQESQGKKYHKKINK